VFLNKIKHPTIRSTYHDAMVTVTQGETFIVMALPDGRDADKPLKANILATAILACFDAINGFADGLGIDTDNPRVQAFSERVSLLDQLTKQAIAAVSTDPLPFDAGDDRRARRYFELLAKVRPRQE
jgi:hypothetical protein